MGIPWWEECVLFVGMGCIRREVQLEHALLVHPTVTLLLEVAIHYLSVYVLQGILEMSMPLDHIQQTLPYHVENLATNHALLHTQLDMTMQCTMEMMGIFFHTGKMAGTKRIHGGVWIS